MVVDGLIEFGMVMDGLIQVIMVVDGLLEFGMVVDLGSTKIRNILQIQIYHYLDPDSDLTFFIGNSVYLSQDQGETISTYWMQKIIMDIDQKMILGPDPKYHNGSGSNNIFWIYIH